MQWHRLRKGSGFSKDEEWLRWLKFKAGGVKEKKKQREAWEKWVLKGLLL